jgi:rhamnosyltransferase
MPQIAAIIVAYHPCPELAENIRAIAPQVSRVIVVDNETTAESCSVVESSGAGNLLLIRNSENLGIAAALNQGVRACIKCGAEWVITLDQDSTAPADFVQLLFSALDECPYRDTVGVIGPVYQDSETGWSSSPEADQRPFREAVSTYTSGSAVRVSCFESCGLFREDYFIDYVDHEFCMRLRAHRFRVLEATQVALQHKLGHISRHRYVGRYVWTTHHHAFRWYYIARNRVALALRYHRQEPQWVRHDMIALVRTLGKILLYEEQKAAKFWNIVRGVAHALRGISGPDNLSRRSRNSLSQQPMTPAARAHDV